MRKSILGLIVLFCIAANGQNNNQLRLTTAIQPSYGEAQEFLVRIGYEDFVAKAQQTIQAKTAQSSVSAAMLKKVSEYYKYLNSSRDLAALSYAFLRQADYLPPSQKAETHALILTMALQQVQPFPLLALEPIFNKEILNSKGSAAAKKRATYIEDRAMQRYLTEKSNILQVLSYLATQSHLYSSLPEQTAFEMWADENLSYALEPQYMIGTRQQNRHLGRALIAVYVKHAIETKNYEALQNLKTRLAELKIELSEILMAKYKLVRNGQTELLQLRSGDLALEYSLGGQAYMISMGVQPATAEDQKIAKKFDLISNYKNIPIATSAVADRATQKLKENHFLTEDEERALQEARDPEISRGYSHSGLVEIKTDAMTGISLAWIWDIFPQNDSLGNVRLMSPEGFAYPERFLRIGFAQYNAEKMRNAYVQQIEARGYLEIVWESYESDMVANENGRLKPSVVQSKRHKWPARITKNETMSLYEKAKQQSADEWYNRELLPRVFNQMRQYVYGPNALVFAKGLVNASSMAYCSQIINLAYLQSVNFDLQNHPDQYRPLPIFLGKTIPFLVPLDFKDRVIAPAGLVWQSHIIEDMHQMNFNRERELIQKVSDSPETTVAARYTNLLSNFSATKAVKLTILPKPIQRAPIDPEDDED